MSIAKGSTRNRLDLFATMWIIFSTGSLVLCIFNMKLSMFVLLGIAAVYAVQNRKVGVKQLKAVLMVFGLVMLNSMVNLRYFVLNKDIAILLIRLASLALICSYMSKETFMENYIKTLFWLCLLSLVCFALSEAGVILPGQKNLWFKNKYYIYTPYHTVGRWYYFHRNAGIFWESPAFAIFINIAVAFLMLGNVKIESKKKTLFFVVFAVTLFSTLAITGYIEFFLVLLAIVFQKRKSNIEENGKESKTGKYIVGLVVIAVVIIFLIRESNTHMITNKILYKVGSYNTRENDSLQALNLLRDRPLTGYGLFNSYTLEALKAVDVTDNSNSFTSLLMYFGVPLFLAYCARFIWGIRQYFNDISIVSFLLVSGAFIVFLNSEQIATMTLFVLFLMPVKSRNDPGYLVK